jgi:hypothetical protein
MSSTQPDSQHLSGAMERVTEELRRIENLLLTGAELDPRVLKDFRDAVNRVRTTAWGVQQYVESRTTDKDSRVVLSVLAGERVRATFMMCQHILADLDNPSIQLQKGQLVRLHDVGTQLVRRLTEFTGA